MAKRGNNEGSITRLPSGRWRAQVTVRGGKRVNYSARTKGECQAWIQDTLGQVRQGLDLIGGSVLLQEYLTRWLEVEKATLRPKTAKQYERIVKNHVIPEMGTVKLRDITPFSIDQFYAKLLENGIGVRTIRLTHSVIHVALEKAVKYGFLLRNPTHKATLPRVKYHEMNVLDESQVTLFLAAAHGSCFEALYHLAVVTGMRQAELFGLKWTDLSWHKGMLHVQRQIQRVSGKGLVEAEPKTRAGVRSIKLGNATLDALRDHLERQNQAKIALGNRWRERDLIFTSSIGSAIDQSNLLKDYYEILEKAGLPRIRFHDLRHTAASLMLNHGVPVIVVSKILGHSKPSVTMDIYGHLYMEMQDEAAQIMDDLVTPIRVAFSPKSSEVEHKNLPGRLHTVAHDPGK